MALRETDELPQCPSCGGSRFQRDSIFSARQDHETTTVEHTIPVPHGAPEWLARAQSLLTQPGDHLVYRDGEEPIETFRIERGWTRIGRSDSADVQLDDPTVSRRHALIVAEPGKGLRVLDDRSMNGVFVNGKRVELKTLRRGDEITVGRFELYLLRA